MMYDVLRILRKWLNDGISKTRDNGSNDDQIIWIHMGSLSFDSMSIEAKVKSKPHTHELVGFSEGAFKEDVLLKELDALDAGSSSDSKNI